MSKSKMRKLNKYRKIKPMYWIILDDPLARVSGGDWNNRFMDDFKGFSLSLKPLSDVNPAMPRHCLEFVV
ncbi:hypothetical protein OZZ08_10160 [Malaciobacter mytili]|uniref:hypothetical protein n=1 Tax=Malaciobacter mytili TaxID=603050 RepID=UPI003BB10AD9